MARDLTLKQSNFVSAFMETGNATEAYRRAYDAEAMNEASINVNACKLLKHTKVALRIAELKERATAKVCLSREWVLERLMRNAEEALKAADFTASNKALELLGKTEELAMFEERKSVTSTNLNHNIEERVSPSADWIAGLVGDSKEASPPKSRQN